MRNIKKTQAEDVIAQKLHEVLKCAKDNPKRFCFKSDGEGNLFLIPSSKSEDFDQWRNLGEDDPQSWTPPEYAKPVEGYFEQITFENPFTNGKAKTT